MLRKLLPKETCFFDFFEQLGAFAVSATEAFQELTRNGVNADVHAARLKDIEHQADRLTHQCIEALNKTFITPMDRSDILALIKRLDDVIDSVDSAASRMSLYELNEVRPEAQKLAEVLVKATKEIEFALKALRDIKGLDAINPHLIAIHQFENDGDVILRAALTKLFREETNAVLIIKWKEIFERLEKATDRCEEVANIVEKIVLEAS